MLRFAIVIPNLNQSSFLTTALKSLRYQESLFELAVMDGGSTDDFKNIIQQYSDIISYKRSKPDKGQSAAIKESVGKISGDIMTWLNADDFYFPGALDKVLNIFNNNPEIDVVYGDAIHVGPEGFFKCYFPPIREFNKTDLTFNNFICQPSCFYRRSIYEKVGGINTNLHYTMDWDLWCRFAEQDAKFHYYPEPLSAVRYYPGTKTLSGTRERYHEIYRIEKKYGKRIIPISTIGAYYLDLTYKNINTPLENIFVNLFDLYIKIRRRKSNQKLLYGFYPWSSIFQKECQIHLPWYDEHEWIKLRLQLKPNNEYYKIKLNNMELDLLYQQNGEIIAEIPEINNCHRLIHIYCNDDIQCELLDISFDLQ